MILLLAAVAPEADMLIPHLKPVGQGPWPLWRGSLSGAEVALVLTGMGLASAGAAAAWALSSLGAFEENEKMWGEGPFCEQKGPSPHTPHPPKNFNAFGGPAVEAVVNFGCAGAYRGSELGLGQAAVADGAVFADLGVATDRRWHDLTKIGVPLWSGPQGPEIFNRLPVDEALSARLAAASGGLPRGCFASVNQVSGDDWYAAQLEKRWGALLEDMETAAIAQTALVFETPFAAVRGVSNLAGARQLDIKAGTKAAQEALLAWLERS